MTVADLKAVLEKEDFDSRVYSLSGGLTNDRLCLERTNVGWSVYYSERGDVYEKKEFTSESEACGDLLQRLRRLPPSQTKRRRHGFPNDEKA